VSGASLAGRGPPCCAGRGQEEHRPALVGRGAIGTPTVVDIGAGWLEGNVGYELGGAGAGALRCVEVRAAVPSMRDHPTLHVRVEPELLAALEALARAEERPVSAWVRRALRSEVRRERGDRGEGAAA
jgi:hypothetical protein